MLVSTHDNWFECPTPPADILLKCIEYKMHTVLSVRIYSVHSGRGRRGGWARALTVAPRWQCERTPFRGSSTRLSSTAPAPIACGRFARESSVATSLSGKMHARMLLCIHATGPLVVFGLLASLAAAEDDERSFLGDVIAGDDSAVDTENMCNGIVGEIMGLPEFAVRTSTHYSWLGFWDQTSRQASPALIVSAGAPSCCCAVSLLLMQRTTG